jgi:hypothetical protein
MTHAEASRLRSSLAVHVAEPALWRRRTYDHVRSDQPLWEVTITPHFGGFDAIEKKAGQELATGCACGVL